MKMKIGAASIVLILLVTTGFVTYAFLTAHASTQNIITAGTVKIELNEAAQGLKVMPATTAQREVIIKNTGANDCYVRVKLDTVFESSLLAAIQAEGAVVLSIDEDSWMRDSEGFWRYENKLAPGESTANLLTGITFGSSMGNEYQNAAFHIYVNAEAVQAANNGYDENVGSVLEVEGWPTAPAPSASSEE